MNGFNKGDAAAAGWVLLWIIVGGLVTHEIHQLAQYGETLEETAGAIETTSEALDTVGGVPLVGGRLDDIASDLEGTAASIRDSARATDSATFRLGWLLGVSIAVIPSFPIVAVYVPSRIRRYQEARRISAALSRGDDDAVEQALIERVYGDLPPEVVENIQSQPLWRDARTGG